MGVLEKMSLGEYEIPDLLPQQPPMIMVDKIVKIENNKIVTGFTVKKNNIFLDNHVLREPGILENMAQTAALHAGYMKKKLSKTVRMGYIAAITNLEIFFLPGLNSEMNTEIIIQHQVFNFLLVSGKSTVNNKLVAQCEMKILDQGS